MSLLVPIGNHIFSAEKLSEIVSKTLPTIPPNRSGAIVAALDQDGVKVALELIRNDSHWTAEAAYAHDWSGNDTIGGKVMFSW